MDQRIEQDRVIQFSALRREAMFPAHSQLLAYWEALRRGRLVPLRSEIDPRGIDRALEYAFILERLSPGLARFRVAGAHLADLIGAEARGLPVSVLFAQGARARALEAIEAVFAGPQILDMVLATENGIGRPPMTGRLLLLPLQSDLGDTSRAIGCIETRGQVGRAPRRFAVEGASHAALAAGQPARRHHAPLASPTGFAEPAAPFFGPGMAAATRPAAARGHLTLVTRND